VLGMVVGIGYVRGGGLNPRVLASVAAGDRPVSVATDGHTIWVADAGAGRVIAFNAGSLDVEWTIAAGPRPVAIAYGQGAVWVVDAGDRRLRKLDPASGRVLGQASTSIDPVAVVVTNVVWVVSAGNATVDGYDPQTLQQSHAILPAPNGTSFGAAANALWVGGGGQLRRAPAEGGVATVVDLGVQVDLIATSGGPLWATTADGQLLAIDAETNVIEARVALSGHATALAADGTAVAVATDDGRVSWFARPGATSVTVSRTGVVLTSLALIDHRIFGTSPDSGLLYRMEITA